jgi:hypothetical protein
MDMLEAEKQALSKAISLSRLSEARRTPDDKPPVLL